MIKKTTMKKAMKKATMKKAMKKATMKKAMKKATMKKAMKKATMKKAMKKPTPTPKSGGTGNNQQSWWLVKYTGGGGCKCLEGKKPVGNNISSTKAFATQQECLTELKVSKCQTLCQKKLETIKALRINITQREKFGEKSPSLMDARELLMIMQAQYTAANCKNKTKPSSSLINSSFFSSNESSSFVNSSANFIVKKKHKKNLTLTQNENNELTKSQDENNELTKSLSWWWPSPPEIIDKMFKIAKVQPGELIYDLGSGDGRIPVQAASKWGCSAVGIDFDDNLCRQAKKRAIRFNVSDKVEIRHQDALKVSDIERADVVCLYILDRGMKLIKPILQSKLKKGTRIVSHNYTFKDWKPTKELMIKDKEGYKHWIYLYIVE